ncbi:MAG: type I-U CRISPR-associated protein Csb2 [Planctomycetaceae bacterium]|nr:type I-U CRISPR-associated protein Csb2 [Planctomycetaceae bacterium]
MSTFRLSFKFLDGMFHGRDDGGAPEWPPSPLRAFQALVDAAATRWRMEPDFNEHPKPALKWLESLTPPSINSPVAEAASSAYRLYVPNNHADVVAAAWARGSTNASIAEHRTEKDVRPTYLRGGDTVHYLYSLPDSECPHLAVLAAAARGITHLGWGVDMVAANADVITDEKAASLNGELWLPVDGPSDKGQGVPCVGTLGDLTRKHAAFLDRLSVDGFKPVPPLSVYDFVGYHRATDRVPPRYAAFSILQPDASGSRAFDVGRRTRDVAGMVRHAVDQQAFRTRPFGWSDGDIHVFVHGKSPDGASPTRGERSPDRFSYLPLPTINHKLKRVEAIRRVLVAAPAHCQQQIRWVQRALAGEELVDETHEAQGLLTILPGSDWVLKQYVGQGTVWTTVTPVILPRHDGYKPAEAGDHIRMAFEQAGFDRQLIEQSAIEWRHVGYRAGADLVSRYLPPENLSHKPRYHVRVQFPHSVSGPIAVGSGRFRGFGLFAAE